LSLKFAVRIILTGCLEITLLKTAVMLSMDPVTVFLYGVFPYIALVLFVGGVLYRLWGWLSAGGLTGLYSVAVKAYSWGFGERFGEVLKRVFLLYTLTMSDRLLLVGSFLFHWGIWIALLGHLSMIVPPEQFGMPKDLHKAHSPLRRRSRRRRLAGGPHPASDQTHSAARREAAELLGRLVRARPPICARCPRELPDSRPPSALRGDRGAVGPERIDGSPRLDLAAQWDAATKIHVFLALLFIAYVPLGKLIHQFSFLAMPTLWTQPTKLYGYLLARLKR
jgi:nitrate reductase gamma subunit